MSFRLPLIFLLALTSLAIAGSTDGHGRARGQTGGGYDVTVAGSYSGSGTATISGASISISTSVKYKGSTGPLTLSGAPIINGYFQGTGSIFGSPCTIEGRVDLPSAQDDQQNDDQAITGRIVATVRDNSGFGARLVGVQNASSRGPGGPSGPGGPGGPGGG